MLLLVLILVLIAFGLLVVALLSGSVLWAWVSVGVSVAAAAVLLVDWLQRRSAVRAGAEAGDAAPIGVAAQLPDRDPIVEPATEIIPAVRADDSAPENRGRSWRPAERRRRTAGGTGDDRSAALRRPALAGDRRALVAVSARQTRIGHRT